MKELLQKWKKGILIGLLLISSVGTFGFIDSYFELNKNLEIFNSLLRELNAYYVDEIKPGDLMKKGIDGMLNSLDPYTEYYPESDIEDYKVMITGQYGGIGASVKQKGDYVVISEPYEGFPAQKVDLRAGDAILEVNGISVKGKNTTDVSKMMKGQPNTSVKLLIEREGEKKPLEKTLIREEIKIKNVHYYGMLNDSVGYIKLTGFTEDAAQEVKDAVNTLKEKNKMKSLVFDLRGNGGGLLREAVDIVNLFVDRGQKIVTQKGKMKDTNKEHVATRSALDMNIPMVVLIDRGSASASEIVAGAIQDLDRGVLIGQRSFGKGLVQQNVQLSYNTQMKVTIAKYYTPSGRCIQALDYFHKNSDGVAEKVPDSLITEYKTKNGRSVYDGSGIYPDISTEQKKWNSISTALLNKNLVFDFATRYRIEHPSASLAKEFYLSDDDFQKFVSFIADKDYDYTTKSEKALSDFKENAQKEKYFDDVQTEYEALKNKISHDKKEDLKKFKPEIRALIEEEIASRYYYQKGRQEASLKADTDIKEAIRVLSDKTLYTSITKGVGDYKVIGKPKIENTQASKFDKEDGYTGDPIKEEEKPVKKEKKKGG